METPQRARASTAIPGAGRIIVASEKTIINGDAWAMASLIISISADCKSFFVIKNTKGKEHDGNHDMTALGAFINEWEASNP